MAKLTREAVLVTPRDAQIIRENIEYLQRLRINHPYLDRGEEPLRSSDVYAAYTPLPGVPARSVLNLGWGECDVYKLVGNQDDNNTDLVAVMLTDDLPYRKLAYNIYDRAIPGGIFVPIVRSRGGKWIIMYTPGGAHHIRFTLTSNLNYTASATAVAYDAWDGSLPSGTVTVWNHETRWASNIYQWRGKVGWNGTAIWDNIKQRWRINWMEHRVGWHCGFTLSANLTKAMSDVAASVVHWWGGHNPGSQIQVWNVLDTIDPNNLYMWEGDNGAFGHAEYDEEADKWRIYLLNCKYIQDSSSQGP